MIDTIVYPGYKKVQDLLQSGWL